MGFSSIIIIFWTTSKHIKATSDIKRSQLQERFTFKITHVISGVVHTQKKSKYLDDQEMMFSTTKERALVTVTAKKERN